MIQIPAWSRYVGDLLATPADSVDHWIAEDIWSLDTGIPAVVAYLAGVMQMHPSCDRAYEVAAEVLRLLVGGAA